jgi:RND family efflux transporter MFP subunit
MAMRQTLARFVVTAAAALFAAFVGWRLWDYYMESPWTRDGRVRADVVAVAPDVSGLVREVAVRDNEHVEKGQLLFRIDSERPRLALRQAEAILAERQAARDQAAREAARYQTLLGSAAVSEQKQEQAQAGYDEADAAYLQALADRDLARLNLARTEVVASVNGFVANLSLGPGDYVATGQGVMALVDSDSLRVEGYFEETKLARIHVGDPVVVRLMGEGRELAGRVDSIAAGVADRERSDARGALANVNPTFNWVRLAQRIPVRVMLDPAPRGVALVVGRTATVTVRPTSDRPAKD